MDQERDYADERYNEQLMHGAAELDDAAYADEADRILAGGRGEILGIPFAARDPEPRNARGETSSDIHRRLAREAGPWGPESDPGAAQYEAG